MTIRKIVFWGLFSIFFLFPLWMFLLWEFQNGSKLDVFILDKTVNNTLYQEHRSLTWILQYDKYLKSDGKLYNLTKDYFGFFPQKNNKYEIHDLSKYSEGEIDELANKYQVFYSADTYGVYFNEWYHRNDINEHSGKLYGGMINNDFLLMKKMAERNKLVICEYNTIATPTPKNIRSKVENMFSFQWSGWAGRYFFSLDTVVNSELPRWVIRLYKKQYHTNWTYTGSGIVFVNESDSIVILENKKDLLYEVPQIITNKYGKEKFGLPDTMNYPYWFDICTSDKVNRMMAYYKINTTENGDSILSANGISSIFPAVLENSQYRFYYFAGDFSDNFVRMRLSKLRGVDHLRSLMINPYDLSDRSRFFWEYYVPLVRTILKDYSKEINQ